MHAIRFAISIFLLTMLAPVGAQTCDELRADGQRALRQRNYRDAINSFLGAMITCKGNPAEFTDLIQQAQASWVRELEAARDQANIAYQQALQAKLLADSAKVQEEIARRDAEANARKAREQGIRAESLRLALLADIIRQKGQKNDALLLAWLATQLSGAELSSFAMRTFGETVRDSFMTTLFRANAPFETPESGGGIHVMGTQDGMRYIFQEKTNAVIPLEKGVSGFQVGARGNYIITWDEQNNAQIRDARGVTLARLAGHTEPIRYAVFSPDEQYIVTCSRDNTARLWDLQGKQRAVLQGHTANVYKAAFSANGRVILTQSTDGSARAWDLDGKCLATVQRPGTYLIEASLDADGGRIIAVFQDGSAALYRVNGEPLYQWPADQGGIRAAQFAGNDQRMILQSGVNNIILSDLQGHVLQTYRHPARIGGWTLDAERRELLSWASDRTLRRWNLASGELLQTYPGYRADIISARYAADKSSFLSTGKDGVVKLCDMQGNVLVEWLLNDNAPLPARYSLDGQSVLTISNGRRQIDRTPIPQVVYDQVNAGNPLGSGSISRLVQDYKVQFSEALGIK